jgi:uncharacterized membrane protein
MIASVVLMAATLGCDRRDAEQSVTDGHKVDNAPFVNKVWSVVESPGGATGDLYVFLSTGTLVIASPEAVPSVGRWSWDGRELTMIEGGTPYSGEIVALTDSELSIKVHDMGKTWDLRFAPAGHAMPDTTRPVEFNPADHKVFADGREPFWHLQVDGGSALLFTSDQKRVQFTNGEWMQVDAPSWEYEARREDEGGEHVLRLTITRSLCTDSELGVDLPLRAALFLDGVRMDGCAFAGRSRSEPQTQ